MSFSSMVFTRFSNARLAYCKLDRARFGACSIDGTKFGFSSVKDTLFTDMVSVQGEEIVGEGPALKLSTATDWTGVDLSIAKVNSRNFCVEEELKKPELEYKRTMAEYRNFNDLS